MQPAAPPTDATKGILNTDSQEELEIGIIPNQQTNGGNLQRPRRNNRPVDMGM